MGIRIAGCLPALVSLQHAELNWPDTQRIGGKKMKFSYHLSNFTTNSLSVWPVELCML
jgi:hypothetical protein